MTPPAVSVVVVNFNGGDDILSCLRSVDASGEGAEVVVVDNASTDGSPDAIAREFPRAKLLTNPRNVGFAAAANRGVRASEAPTAFLLNPDATLGPGALERLGRSMEERPRAGAIGALVRNPDGSIQPSKRAFPTLWQSLLHGLVGLFWQDNPGTRAYLLSGVDQSEPVRVGWVAANSVLLRREAFEEAGGFDEAFFFFVEDVDLCKRLWDAGWEVWFEPRAEVVHAWGGSWTRKPLRFLWLHHRNLFRYVTKHRRGAWALLYPLIAAGLGLRFVLVAVRWILARRTVPAHRGRKEVAG